MNMNGRARIMNLMNDENQENLKKRERAGVIESESIVPNALCPHGTSWAFWILPILLIHDLSCLEDSRRFTRLTRFTFLFFLL